MKIELPMDESGYMFTFNELIDSVDESEQLTGYEKKIFKAWFLNNMQEFEYTGYSETTRLINEGLNNA